MEKYIIKASHTLTIGITGNVVSHVKNSYVFQTKEYYVLYCDREPKFKIEFVIKDNLTSRKVLEFFGKDPSTELILEDLKLKA